MTRAVLSDLFAVLDRHGVPPTERADALFGLAVGAFIGSGLTDASLRLHVLELTAVCEAAVSTKVVNE